MESLPKTWSDVYALLANPLSIAMLISWIYTQVPFFQSETFPGLAKIGIVIGTGLAWSGLVALFSPTGLPTTPAAWGPVVLQGLGVGFGSVAFHQLVEKYFPALAGWLLALKTDASKTISVTTSTTGNGTSSTMHTEETKPLPPAEPATPVLPPDDHG